MPARGDIIGDRYVVDDVLAHGGMSDVYRARDRDTGRPVAIKLLRAGAADPRRFAAEVRILEMLEHPNLVRLRDAGRQDGLPYLVLDLVDGETLSQRLGQGPLGVDEARSIGCDIARALDYVHGRGVVHRDVKPSNILLARDGRALLTDFGIARLADATQVTAPGTMVGTVAYLAPEQLRGEDVGPEADLFSLGLVLIEALSGEAPPPGTPAEVAARRLRSRPPIPPGLPPPWPELLLGMTARAPAARPDAASVAAHLGSSPQVPRSTGPLAAALATAAMARPEGRTPGPRAEHTTVVAAPTAGATAPTFVRATPDDGSGREPALRPVLWLFAALAVLLVAGLAIAVDGDGELAADDPTVTSVTAAEQAVTTAPPTTAPPTTAAPTTTPTTVADERGGPPNRPRGASPAAADCSALEARKNELEDAKHQVDETYRGDRATRERRKAEIEEQKAALDAQKQALGC
jgi:eukaryotic-like serine/threonine-protein kinase